MTERNENRRGYKKTKVGWIPEGWNFDYVGNVYSIENRFRLPISREERRLIQGEYPYYGPTGILDYIDHYRVEGTFALIGEDGDHFLKYRTRPMTQLISGKFNVNNHAHLIKGNSKSTAEWFYWFFHHRDIKAFLTRQGAGRFKLNKEALIKLPMVYPPLPEQKKIAEILSTCERTIHLTARMIEAKEKMKKGLMQQLLTGRLRFPEFGKPATKKGEVPDGWRKELLEDVLGKIIGGGTPSKNNKAYWNGSIPWATVKDISNGNKDGTIDYITVKGLKNSSSNLIPRGTNIVATRIAVGSNIRYTCDVAINQDLKALFPNQKILDDYLYWVLILKSSLLSSLGNGSTVSGIRLEDLKGIPIKLPRLQEQHKISEILTTHETEINLLRNQLAAHKKQKKALMQKLLTGQIRVKV
jgi:type I restriction enzyme, S subunit